MVGTELDLEFNEYFLKMINILREEGIGFWRNKE